MSAYGLDGVDRSMQLLQDEMEMNMRLIGCSSLSQFDPSLVDTQSLGTHSTLVPVDSLGLTAYDPVVNPKQKSNL